LRRRINFRPTVKFFKPRGVPMRNLEIENLSHEEIEALRLRHLQDLEQEEVARRMNTSRTTVQRILDSGYKKLIAAIVKGRAIEIEE